MKKHVSKRRRRNPDEDLRKLHRKAQQGAEDDVEKYWRACVRAGEIPEPNAVVKASVDIETKVWDLYRFTLELWSDGVIWQLDTDYDATKYRAYLGLHKDLAYAEIKIYIKWYLDRLEAGIDARKPRKYRPRKNPDEDLRKLHRKAQQGADDDIEKYWRACLRTGITPEPTATQGATKIWRLGDKQIELYTTYVGNKIPYGWTCNLRCMKTNAFYNIGWGLWHENHKNGLQYVSEQLKSYLL